MIQFGQKNLTLFILLTTFLGHSQGFTLVVLGSSTPAGKGASKPDSAWVNRFRAVVLKLDAKSSVINLARGSQTTFNVLPDGYQLDGYPATNPDNNITKALSYNPNAIIVNLPSNDAQAGYNVEKQLRNYFILDSIAKQNKVPIWFVSPQPRNFTSEVFRLMQLELKDSLLSIYKDFSIDVFTTLADENYYVYKEYDFGDGIHINDTGHRVLFEVVSNSTLYEYITKFILDKIDPKIEGEITCYPNPFRNIVTIELPSDVVFPVDLSIYNIQSNSFEIKVVLESQSDLKIKTPLEKLSKGAYLLKISNSNMEYNTKLVKLD